MRAEQAAAADARPKGKRVLPTAVHPAQWSELPLLPTTAAGTQVAASAAAAPVAPLEIVLLEVSAAGAQAAVAAPVVRPAAAEDKQQQQPMEVDVPSVVPQQEQLEALEQPLPQQQEALPTQPAQVHAQQAQQTPLSEQQPFVARSPEQLSAALWGAEGGPVPHQLHSPSSSPVTLALCAGRSQWRLWAGAGAGAGAGATGASGCGGAGGSSTSSQACLVEVTVHPVGGGAPAEGAALCYLPGQESRLFCRPLHLQQGRRQGRQQQQQQGGGGGGARAGSHSAAEDAAAGRCAGMQVDGAAAPKAAAVDPGSTAGSDAAEGLPADGKAAGAEGSGWSWEEEQQPLISEAQLATIGYVTSELPRGAPRPAGALALASASALWHLRALQLRGQRQGDGSVLALLRNPRSSALHPVRLRLLVERADA